jgi:hypothetical protein
MNEIKKLISSALGFEEKDQVSTAYYKYLESINLIASELYQNAVYNSKGKKKGERKWFDGEFMVDF